MPLAPTPPHWVREYLTREQPPPLTLLTSNIPNATALSAAGLSDAVADVYRRLLSEMQAEARHAVRMWNFVPSIQGELGAGDRYMAFNAGRFAAFSESFGLANDTPAAIPTASAVGIDGTTLWIHVLAADAPGVPLENPRQVPAYRYSRRYGLRPPCFARATKFESTLLIGGTASIIGEDSRHAAAIVGADRRDALQPASADCGGHWNSTRSCPANVARRPCARHQCQAYAGRARRARTGRVARGDARIRRGTTMPERAARRNRGCRNVRETVRPPQCVTRR